MEKEPELSDEEVSRFLGKKNGKSDYDNVALDGFSTEAEALRLPGPDPGKTHVEYWMRTGGQRHFGIRIMRAKKNGGEVRKTWICRHLDAEGKDQKKSVGLARWRTMDEAQYDALRMRREAAMRRDAGMPEVPLFGKAFDEYVRLGSRRWSPATIAMYEKANFNLKDLRGTKCSKITPTMCEKLVEDLQKRVVARSKTFETGRRLTGLSTAREAMRAVCAVFKALMEDGTVSHNPTARLRRQGFFRQEETRVDAIHIDDMPKVWSYLHTRVHASVRDYVIFAIVTGFRRSLLGKLRWDPDRLDQKSRSYIVKKNEIGNKAKKDFAMPLPNGFWDMVIVPRLSDPHRHREWIIESPKKAGKPLTSIRGTLATMAKETGISVTVHGLRRTAATLMAAQGEIYAARLLTHRLVDCNN